MTVSPLPSVLVSRHLPASGAARATAQPAPSVPQTEIATHAFRLSVEGEGFLKLQAPDGARYLKSATLGLDAQGELVTPQGFRLSPSVCLPGEATGLVVQRDGKVLALFPDGRQAEAGWITLACFPDPGALLRAGDGSLVPFPAAGIPRDGLPGTGGLGALAAGEAGGSFPIRPAAPSGDAMLGTLVDMRC